MTQPFHITLPVGLDFQPNLEEGLHREQTRLIRQCLTGITNSVESRTPGEEALLVAWPHHEDQEAESYTDSLTALSRAISSNDQYLTAYKMLVFAALVSSRSLNIVMNRLEAARTAFKLEPFHAMIVSEGVARRTGVVPANAEALSDGQKLAILSLAFRMLQTDDGRHIKEMGIFRVIMTTLGTQDVKAEALQAGLKRTTLDLCNAIGDDGALTAVLAMLRMATADGQIRLREQEILKQLSQSTNRPAAQFDRLTRFVQIETGVVLTAPDSLFA